MAHLSKTLSKLLHSHARALTHLHRYIRFRSLSASPKEEEVDREVEAKSCMYSKQITLQEHVIEEEEVRGQKTPACYLYNKRQDLFIPGQIGEMAANSCFK